jgi:DNA helicase-2/ATP-dependent DNA helicase PcrA
MDELYLTTCRDRLMYGRTERKQPSLFLREINKSCLKGDTFVLTSNRHVPAQSGTHGGVQSGGRLSDPEKRAGWHKGQQVFNNDYGYGVVTNVIDSEDGIKVHVRFSNRHEKSFLSEIHSGSYEKVTEDY